MGTPNPEERTPVWAVVAAIGGFVVCCAGPAVLVLLTTTGLGVALAQRGLPLVAGLVVALAAAVIVWRRRARACQVPRYPSAPEGPHGTSDSITPPRRDRAGVP